MLIRPAEPRDLPALRAMLEQRDGCRLDADAVARHYLHLDPRHIAVRVAEHDGRVVGQTSIRHRTLVHGRRVVKAAYWTDLYVDEGARDLMLYVPLARGTLDVARETGAELTYTANRRPDVYRAHLRLGFRIAGIAPTRARPLRPLGFAARRAFGDAALRPLAPADRWLMSGVARLERRAALVSADVACSVGPVERPGLDEAVALFAASRKRLLAQPFDAETCAARYATPLDGRPFHRVDVRRSGRLVATAVVRTARRGPFEATVVMDLAHRADRAAAHAAIAQIEAFGVDQGSDLALVLDACPDLDGLWEGVGYRTTPEQYLLLVAPADRAVDPLLGNASGWRFAFADHDAF